MPTRLDPALPPLPRFLKGELERSAAPLRREEALARAQKALAEEAAGRLAQAITAARRVKEAAPRSPQARELLGRLYLKRGWHKDALPELKAYRRITGRRDHDPEIADCERALGKQQKALDVLAELLEDPPSVDAAVRGHIVRSRIHEDAGHPDAAIGALRAAGRVKPPHDLPLAYALADLLDRTGEAAEARGLFGRIDARDTSFRDAAERAKGP